MVPKAMSPGLLSELAERFKALGEPARLQLLSALREGEQSVTELVVRTGLGQANVSKHLQQLCTAGFITRRKEGTFAYYALADDEVFALCDAMCGRIEVDQQRKRAALRVAR
jgi:DNA-binding transcriptional ArsR family regulator